jgi:hypothetical protein
MTTIKGKQLYTSAVAAPGARAAWSSPDRDRSLFRSLVASREIAIGRFSPTINVNLSATVTSKVDVVLPYLNYAFATPVFGGQLGLGMFGIVGNNSTGLDGTLTLASGPFVITRQGSISQTARGVGDLYPEASVRWNNGVNN